MTNHANDIIKIHRDKINKFKKLLSKPVAIILQIISFSGAAWTISGFKQSIVALVIILLTAITLLFIIKYLIRILENNFIFLNINKLEKIFTCPFYSEKYDKFAKLYDDENKCPLGLIDIKESARDTLLSLLETQKEYYFLGFGSENIFMKIKESDELKKFQDYINSHKDETIKISIIIRDPKDKELVKQLESLRYKNQDLKKGETFRELTNAIKLHDIYRNDFNWDITTYISNRTENFRIVVVDEFAYVSCNESGKSHLSAPQLIFKKSKSSINLISDN